MRFILLIVLGGILLGTAGHFILGDPKEQAAVEQRRQGLLEADAKSGDAVKWIKDGGLSCAEVLEAKQSGDHLLIRLNLKLLWGGSKEVHGSTGTDSICYVPKVFATFPELRTMDIAFNSELTDIKGHQSNEEVVRFKFSRNNADSVSWDHVDPDNVRKFADQYWESPVVTNADRGSPH